jgi:hypothetical protein
LFLALVGRKILYFYRKHYDTIETGKNLFQLREKNRKIETFCSWEMQVHNLGKNIQIRLSLSPEKAMLQRSMMVFPLYI